MTTASCSPVQESSACSAPRLDEQLISRLPLPLALLCRRAHNATTPLEQHLTAYYLWEASLKLLGSVAVVEYAALGDQDADLLERLKNLARPAVGHWWEFVRRLTPLLADRADAGFAGVRDLLLGRAATTCRKPPSCMRC